MDLLSYQDTSVHRLNPVVKLLTTLVFIVTVLSFGRYEISMLVPFAVFPVYIITMGNIPAGYIIQKILFVSPFALMIGIFNPLFDTKIQFYIGSAGISGGWLSFVSIMMRFCLTVGAALALIASTGFNNLCFAMNRLGVPKMFSVQLLFLYRYLFVIAEEAARMIRARNIRSFNGKGKGIKTYGPIVGTLLVRTVNRAQRIHLAMNCRGFDGNIRVLKKYGCGFREIFFIVSWCGLFALFRSVNVSQLAGIYFLRLFS